MTASINSISKIATEKSEATRGLISTVETGRNKDSISNDQIKNISTDIDNMMDIIGALNSIKFFKRSCRKNGFGTGCR